MLDHAGVLVADIERSVRFYCDVLGLHETTRVALGDEQLVFLAAGGGFVELVSTGRTAARGGVVDHLALRVPDVGVALQRLREHGAHVLDEQPLDVPQLPARIAFVEGPDGERIELIERP